MENNSKAAMLRIFVSSTDKRKQQNLAESIVFDAKKNGIAGATVLRGIVGYGASSIMHSYKFWEIAEKVPTVIEIIDERVKVEVFYKLIKPQLESMRYGCLVTIQNVEVLLYKTGQKRMFDL